MNIAVALLVMLSLLGNTGACAQDSTNDPEANFEFLWHEFDKNYAIFGPKHIDWDALYRIYRPQVTAETSDDELYKILCSMLGHLNDNHVRLIYGERRFYAGILNNLTRGDYSTELVASKYLRESKTAAAKGSFTYGWLSDSIGYFHFPGFGDPAASAAAVDELLDEFKNAKGLVIDVRGNGGGDDLVGKVIADRFSDRKRHYMTTRIKRGDAHDDFYPPMYWYAEPGGPRQFTKPIVLLTHRFSVSAADNFTLAMRVLPHVTVVGDFTSGCFADAYGSELPNGWRYGLAYTLFTDYSGFCWEGIGVPPDIRQLNTPEEIEAGTDRQLELAIALLEKGELKPQDESASCRELRTSLPALLAETIEKEGIEAAVAEFERLSADESGQYFFSPQGMLRVAMGFMQANKLDEAVAVLRLVTEHFPKLIWTYEMLAQAHLAREDNEAAAEVYRKMLELKPKFNMDRRALQTAREFLGKR